MEAEKEREIEEDHEGEESSMGDGATCAFLGPVPLSSEGDVAMEPFARGFALRTAEGRASSS